MSTHTDMFITLKLISPRDHEIMQAYLNGTLINELAEKFNCTQPMIYHVLNHYEVLAHFELTRDQSMAIHQQQIYIKQTIVPEPQPDPTESLPEPSGLKTDNFSVEKKTKQGTLERFFKPC